MAICLSVHESVKLILTSFALLAISVMSLAQNTGLMFPNFRLQGLVYMSERVYCCSLKPSPFSSNVLQSSGVSFSAPLERVSDVVFLKGAANVQHLQRLSHQLLKQRIKKLKHQRWENTTEMPYNC